MERNEQDIENFTAEQILQMIDGRIDLETNRIVGVYFEAASSLLIGGGGEGVFFRGVDTQTGEIVTAFYLGGVLGAAFSPTRITIGGGVFGFTGAPEDLGGWSVGGQANAVVAAGVSVAIPSGHILYFSGANLSAGANAAAGATLWVRVGDETIYSFGQGPIPTFNSSSQIMPVLNQLPTHGDIRYRTLVYDLDVPESDYNIRQEIVRIGEFIRVESWVVDEFGSSVNGPVAQLLLASRGLMGENFDGDDAFSRIYFGPDDSPPDPISGTVEDFFSRIDDCFLYDTMISMWPRANGSFSGTADDLAETAPDEVWEKPIQELAVNDWVVSFDRKGRLCPGRVKRVFRKEAKIILDFFGVFVTPGHVYYRADSEKTYAFEPLIDILRDDGVVQVVGGVKIRAATGVPLDDPRDRFVWAIAGDVNPNGPGIRVHEKGRLRLGTRFITQDGRDFCIADLIEIAGGVVTDEGLIRIGDAEMPFHWSFGEQLPKPEDYILQRSGTTLVDIYRAAEWERRRPSSPAPLMMGGGPVQPFSQSELADMPRNMPLALRGGAYAAAKRPMLASRSTEGAGKDPRKLTEEDRGKLQ